MNNMLHYLSQLLTAVRCMTMTAMLLLVVSLVACSDDGGVAATEETNPTDNPVNPEDYQTVPTSGGTLNKGDIAITFPENTFSGETKVAVSDVKTGEVAGEEEVSKFYQLTLPPQINKPLTMSIESKSIATRTDRVIPAIF